MEKERKMLFAINHFLRRKNSFPIIFSRSVAAVSTFSHFIFFQSIDLYSKEKYDGNKVLQDITGVSKV